MTQGSLKTEAHVPPLRRIPRGRPGPATPVSVLLVATEAMVIYSDAEANRAAMRCRMTVNATIVVPNDGRAPRAARIRFLRLGGW